LKPSKEKLQGGGRRIARYLALLDTRVERGAGGNNVLDGVGEVTGSLFQSAKVGVGGVEGDTRGGVELV
jgi:hypothetical protein